MDYFKKGIVVVPDDFKGVDWVEKCRAATFGSLASGKRLQSQVASGSLPTGPEAKTLLS